MFTPLSLFAMERSVGEFIALQLVTGFIGAYFWWVVAAVIRRTEAEHRAIARRADEHHARALAGDQRGT